MGSYVSESNCSGRWRREINGHMYHIKGLADLSAGSPLSAKFIFLFWWATGLHELCSAWREFSSLHRLLQNISYKHCFGCPELIFSLIKCLPIIPFRLLETNVRWNQSSHAMNVLLPTPLPFIILFAKVTTPFLKSRISFQHRSLITYSRTLHCCEW